MREEQWRYLAELNRSHSINATSQKLNISSQALGASIRSLEAELDLTLLNRSHLGVTLTDNGQNVLTLAEQFWKGIQSLQQAERDAALPASYPQTLDMWVSHGGMACYAPQMIRKLSLTMPNLKISVYEETEQALIEKLRKREIAFALTMQCSCDDRYIHPLPDDVDFIVTTSSKFYCLVPPNSPLAAYKTLSIKTAVKHPLLLYTPNGKAENSPLPILQAVAQPQDYTLEASHIVYKAKMLSSNVIGFTFTNSMEVDGMFESALKKIPISDNIRLDIGCMFLKGNPLEVKNPLFRHFLQQ